MKTIGENVSSQQVAVPLSAGLELLLGCDGAPPSHGWQVQAHDLGLQKGTLTLTAGGSGFVGSATVRLVSEAGKKPYFMLPGLLYELGRRIDRPTYMKIGPTDLGEFTASSWTFAVDRLSHPMALFHDGVQWSVLEAGPHYRVWDEHGREMTDCGAEIWQDDEPQVAFGVALHEEVAILSCQIPASEGPRRLVRNRYDKPVQRQLRLPAGWRLEMTMIFGRMAGTRSDYTRLLRLSYDRTRGEHIPARPLGVAEAANTAFHGIRAWHWIDDPGYTVYTAAFDRSAEFNANNRGQSLGWHFEALGFVGGFFVAFALLWYGQRFNNPDATSMARRLMARWIREAPTDWGFFRTSYHPGPAKTPNGLFSNPAAVGTANSDPTGQSKFYGSCWFGQKHLHARTTSDASMYLARCLRLIPPTDPEYTTMREVLRKSLEAAVGVQRPDGRFGQVYELETRSICQDIGAGGVLWMAAFGEAIPLFTDDPAFQELLRDAVLRAGDGYAPDLDDAWLVGAPEDTSVAPNSESGDCFMLAYEACYALAPNARNLERYRRSAEWMLSWRRTFNSRFHPRSQLGAFNFRTAGADLASSQNNQVHMWGIHSLASLYKLSRLTGDSYFAARADDHWGFAGQLLCTVPGQWNGQRGMCSEQFYCSDWSIWDAWDPTIYHEQKGTIMGFSHLWCVAFFILAAEQCVASGRAGA